MKILDEYFAGTMSKSDKKKLFDELKTNEALRDEFIRIRNTLALTSLYACRDDAAYAIRMKRDLMRQFGIRRTRHILTEVMKYAAIVILIIVNACFFYDKYTDDNIVVQNIIEAPEGQHVHLTFADGTQAWLRPRTVVKLPSCFGKKERLIELDGEGYFSVAEDPQRPFVVRTKQYDIKALGTTFNVFAYSVSPRFETNLADGKVAVIKRDNPESTVILTSGQTVSLENDTLNITKAPYNNENFIKKGIFTFSNKSLTYILDYLSLWYDIRFEIETTFPLDRQYSGKVRQSDDVKLILKALQDIHPFKFKEISEKTIGIY
jgi:ferric-dicitrate binding protein FerR (iron transport regulator)